MSVNCYQDSKISSLKCFFFFQFLSEHLFVFVYYQPKPFYITLTVHREEISSFGSTISTEGSVQTDFFMQLILKPSKGE